MRYAIVIEKAVGNYSAYVPDLPGCVATGPTVQAVEQDIRDAIRFHVAGLRRTACRSPLPRASPNTSRPKRPVAPRQRHHTTHDAADDGDGRPHRIPTRRPG